MTTPIASNLTPITTTPTYTTITSTPTTTMNATNAVTDTISPITTASDTTTPPTINEDACTVVPTTVPNTTTPSTNTIITSTPTIITTTTDISPDTSISTTTTTLFSSPTTSHDTSTTTTINQDINGAPVEVKTEPPDLGYETSQLDYRAGAVVISDDDSSSDSSIGEIVHDNSEVDLSDEEVKEKPVRGRQSISTKFKSRTLGEIFPEELPPLEYLTISPDENVVLEQLGVVSGIVEVLVIVKALPYSPALFDDTILFLEGRQPLGLIFEVLGTVEQPYYSIRFNSITDIQDRTITVGDKVLFAPKADNLTKYVFIAELKKMKCDDASWEHDNEPPATFREFSDDEEERKARRLRKNKSEGTEDSSEQLLTKKKRKRKPAPASHYTEDSQGPQLLQGDLNRNPFGNTNQKFSSAFKQQPWRNKETHSDNSSFQSYPRQRAPFPPSQHQPRPMRPHTSQQPLRPAFGEQPRWTHQPGMYNGSPAPASESWQFGQFQNHAQTQHEYGKLTPRTNGPDQHFQGSPVDHINTPPPPGPRQQFCQPPQFRPQYPPPGSPSLSHPPPQHGPSHVSHAPPQHGPSPMSHQPPQHGHSTMAHAPPQHGPSPMSQAPPQHGPSHMSHAPPQHGPSHMSHAPPQHGPCPTSHPPPQHGPSSHMSHAPPQHGPSHMSHAPPQHIPSHMSHVPPQHGPSHMSHAPPQHGPSHMSHQPPHGPPLSHPPPPRYT